MYRPVCDIGAVGRRGSTPTPSCSPVTPDGARCGAALDAGRSSPGGSDVCGDAVAASACADAAAADGYKSPILTAMGSVYGSLGNFGNAAELLSEFKRRDKKSDSPRFRAAGEGEVRDALVSGASVLVYMLCSVSMILLNKLVTTRHRLEHFALVMVLLQCVAGAALAHGLRRAGWVEYPPLSGQVVKAWLPVTALFVAMLVTSLLSLHYMSLAMYTLLKNGALFLTALGDTVFFRRELASDHLIGFYFMLLGSVLSAQNDRWLTAEGVMWTVLNIVFTASYNLYLKQVLHRHREWGGHWAPMYYNNLMSVFLVLSLLAFAGVTGGGSDADGALARHAGGLAGFAAAAAELSAEGQACVVAFVAAGAVLSGASLWCMKHTSPTTYCVAGATCKIPNIVLGAIIFNQFPSRRGVLGIIVAFCGIYLYTWACLVYEKRDKAPPAAAVRKHSTAGSAFAQAVPSSSASPVDGSVTVRVTDDPAVLTDRR